VNPGLPGGLPMMKVRQAEFERLAAAMGKATFLKYLVMNNGVYVGWRSKRFAYVSPIAYRVAIGSDVSGYCHERDKKHFMIQND